MFKNLPPVPSLDSVCSMFRCTKEQAIAQYRKNIADGKESAAKAAASKSGKYRGFTSAQWDFMNARQEKVLTSADIEA